MCRTPPRLAQWTGYERGLTPLLARRSLSALCQFTRPCAPEILLDVIRAHPIIIVRGSVCQNMYHVPPDEPLAPDGPAREVERLLSNLAERHQIETALRQQGSDLRRSE